VGGSKNGKRLNHDETLPFPIDDFPHAIGAGSVRFVFSAAAQEARMPDDLGAVRDEYLRRTDAALLPVKLWYRQQLQQLEQNAMIADTLELQPRPLVRSSKTIDD
jgi:hypothetical protein